MNALKIALDLDVGANMAFEFRAVLREVKFPATFNNSVYSLPSGVDWAMYLASVGFSVFPIVPNRKTPYKTETINKACGLPDDHRGGFHHGTRDKMVIRAMWSDDRSQAWVGIATGAKSGVYVLDLDRKDDKDGLATIQSLHLGIPQTVWCNTISGGLHYYFKIEQNSGQTFRSDSDVLGAGVDRRGDGGYVVFYGADVTQPMAAPPDWLLTKGGTVAGSYSPREGYLPLGTDKAPSFSDATHALNAHDAVAPYDDWRDTLAAYRQAATGTVEDSTVETTARLWSMGSPDKFNDAAFDKLWRSLDRGTVLGWKYLRDSAIRSGKVSDDHAARWRIGGQQHILPPGASTTPTMTINQSTTQFYLDQPIFGSLVEKPITSELYKNLRDNNLPIGFNEFKQRIEKTGMLPWETNTTIWAGLDDIYLECWFHKYDKRPTMEAVRNTIALYADQNKFDPVADYLNGLVWDGVNRLDGMLAKYFKAENVDFANLISAKFLIGTVARIFDPGCQRDEVLILEGAQGIGKSSSVEILAGAEYFSDSLPNMKDKEGLQHLVGLWICEIGELAATRKADREQIKGFLSKRTDKFRPPYGRHDIEQKRTCVFVATTNDDLYLNDPTGARRWWPVKCGGPIDLGGLRRDRDQLFAEAVHRYHNGQEWWLSDATAKAVAADNAAERQEVDPWQDRVSQHCTTMGDMPIKIETIFKTVLGIDYLHQHAGNNKRVKDILTKLGYVQKRTATERFYVKR
ncbi:VapE domain-containing protein [Primorskyibacter sp. 2E233]|uniref:VapE domain-containing protein n=1 Tax=Primorskyibacter sp. 2E233 TaxID=3413431 RepID=UPI003BF18FF7